MATVDLDKAVEALREEIRAGVFIPGQRLVESDLMEHLSITRGTVREVFRHLETEGLIKIEKNRGAIVRKISREELAHITEVLEDISVLTLRKIGERLDSAATQKILKQLLKETRKFRISSTEISSVKEYMDENARFWGTLAEILENPVLFDIRLKLQSQLYHFAMEGLIVSRDKDRWITLHEDIVSSLLKDDVGHAVRYARKSMKDVWSAIAALPDRAFSKSS